MTDPVQKVINDLGEKVIAHGEAIAALAGQVLEAYPGELGADAAKQVEVFAGRIVADIENGTLDTYTAVTSVIEARDLAKSGIADFADLIQVGAE